MPERYWEDNLDFYIFRFSLKPKISDDLFKYQEPEKVMPREVWLRLYFSEPRSFEHANSLFEYVPADDISHTNPPSHLIFGELARSRMLAERTPPSEGLRPTEHESWQAAAIIIDPTEHEDGQKVAIQLKSDIGKPRAVIKSLAKAINTTFEPNVYDVHAAAVVQESSFKKWAEQHSYKVKRLTFDVAVPNMFDGASNFYDEHRKLRQDVNVSRVQTQLESDSVLKTQDNEIEEIIEYTEKGIGSVRARAVDGSKYNSKNHEKHVELDVQESEGDRKTFWSHFMTQVDRIF